MEEALSVSVEADESGPASATDLSEEESALAS